MIWVSWRQHRSQAITGLGLLCALAVYGIVLGLQMRNSFSQNNLATCLAHSLGASCPNSVATFDNSFGSLVNIGFWAVLLLLPGLIGAAVGAPLLGREMELGTWRLAWSQTVPRTRWLVIQLAVAAGGLIVLGAAMTLVITWYRAPMDRLTGHFIHNAYDYEGLVFTAYILFAFGLAVLAGQLLRRSIPALLAALVPWVAVRIFVEFVLRPHFMTPLKLTGAISQNCSQRRLRRQRHRQRAADHRAHRRPGCKQARKQPVPLPARQPVLGVPVHRGRHLRRAHSARARRHGLARAPARSLTGSPGPRPRSCSAWQAAASLRRFRATRWRVGGRRAGPRPSLG